MVPTAFVDCSTRKGCDRLRTCMRTIGSKAGRQAETFYVRAELSQQIALASRVEIFV